MRRSFLDVGPGAGCRASGRCHACARGAENYCPHAIVAAREKLYPGATAVVIGVGGLGHVAVQIIRAISQATVIAVDLGEDKLALARAVGAHHTVTSDASAAARIRELTDGLGASAVFDFVGVQPTLDLAREVAAIDSYIHIVGIVGIVGIGGGLLSAGFFSTPMGPPSALPTGNPG